MKKENLNFEIIHSMIEVSAEPKYIELTYGKDENLLKYNVRINLSLTEQILFAEKVVENAFVDNVPSKTLADLAYHGYFVLMFTDLPEQIGFGKTEDDTVELTEFAIICKTLDMIKKACAANKSFGNLMELLKNDINCRMDFETQKLLKNIEAAAIENKISGVLNNVKTLFEQFSDPATLEALQGMIAQNPEIK